MSKRKRYTLPGERQRHPGRFLLIVGTLCLVAALALTVYAVFLAVLASNASSAGLASYEAQAGAISLPAASDDPNREMPVISTEGAEYIGTVEMPSLGIKLPVQSEWSYPNLRTSPCRYTGSAYNGTLVIAAHNYPAHFGRIGDLHSNDLVRFTDAEGTRIDYLVIALDILSPTDVEDMTECPACDLTLFTCTLGGTSRVTVRCKRV